MHNWRYTWEDKDRRTWRQYSIPCKEEIWFDCNQHSCSSGTVCKLTIDDILFWKIHSFRSRGHPLKLSIFVMLFLCRYNSLSWGRSKFSITRMFWSDNVRFVSVIDTGERFEILWSALSSKVSFFRLWHKSNEPSSSMVRNRISISVICSKFFCPVISVMLSRVRKVGILLPIQNLRSSRSSRSSFFFPKQRPLVSCHMSLST